MIASPETNRTHLPLIEYKNVSVIRNGRTVLDNINLCVNSGEHVAILGPNGAGKSSLIKTITREYYPVVQNHNSYVRILGEESWDIFELRSHLGIVNGDLLRSTFRDFTCREMVLSGFFSSVGIWKQDEITAKMEKKAADVMRFLNISAISSRSVDEISTGESRLVLIARALVNNPPTLLLDEPTSSLDPRASYELRQTLRKIAAQEKSLVMITHNLSDIIPEIERVILIRQGRVIEDGKKDRILNSRTLSSLFGIKLKMVRQKGYYHSI